ncbi:MAG: DUF2256 domain-containing protein [Janthinobacterium lividum]
MSNRRFNGLRGYVGGADWLLGFYRFTTLCMLASQKKGQLPTKICATCGRPFEYRKKWRNNWPEVKYCGEKCQRNKPAAVVSS